jgi:hypothetical protein
MASVQLKNEGKVQQSFWKHVTYAFTLINLDEDDQTYIKVIKTCIHSK